MDEEAGRCKLFPQLEVPSVWRVPCPRSPVSKKQNSLTISHPAGNTPGTSFYRAVRTSSHAYVCLCSNHPDPVQFPIKEGKKKLHNLAPGGEKLIRVVWVRCKDRPDHEAQHLHAELSLFPGRQRTWQTRRTPPSMASFLEDMFSMIAPAIAMAEGANL